MKKNIFVTGGAGYIGSHICKELFKKGYTPICFDNLSLGHEYAIKWGPFIQGDLQDKHTLIKAFSQYTPIAVMHFAASAYVQESVQDPEKYYKNNLLSTLNLLEIMKNHKVKDIVFSSTCAIYGTPKKIPILEEDIKNPINPYGRSKLMIEKILEDYSMAYNIKYASLRYFNAAGADLDMDIGEHHENETHIIPLAIKTAMQKGIFKIFGSSYKTFDKTAVRDYIHVTDLASAHIKALEYILKNKKNISVNLGSGIGTSVLEMVHSIKKYTGLDFTVVYDKKRRGDPPHLLADIQKAKKLLKWSPKYSDLKTIILSAYNWEKSL